MDWLITALSALRELKDYRGRRAGRSDPAPADPKAPSPSLTIEPIGPAMDTSVVSNQRNNGKPRRPPPPRQAPPAPPAEPPRPDGATDLPHQLIDRDALDVVRRLRRHGHLAYLVGGCVRDLSLGLTPKDFDIATSARPEEIRAVFRNCRIIGRRFRLAHVYFRGGKIIETATFRAQAGTQETEEESEEPADLLIRHDNIFGTAEEDARRRDFTINGLFYDPAAGKIIDYVNGIEDLKSRTVRMIGNPDIRLREDPVRILRAVRIAAKTGLSIDPELLQAMARHRGDIARCSRPRLLEETMKLFRAGFAERGFSLLLELGLLGTVLARLDRSLSDARAQGDGVAEAAVRAHLDALDRLVRRQGTTDAVVLGALYLPWIEAQLEQVDSGHRTVRTAEVVAEIAAEMSATRRTTERLRQLLLAQRHLERPPPGKRGRRRGSPGALMTRPYFVEALDLFEIRMRAADQPLDEVERWRARSAGVEAVEGDEAEGNGERQRRRRRRPRRRTNSASIASESSAPAGVTPSDVPSGS